MPADHFGSGEATRLCEEATLGGKGLLLIFDEFDCLSQSARSVFAPTIKELSDNSVDATILLVGVAADVRELIAEHASIDRCMVQVGLPAMAPDEIRDLIDRALAAVGMTIDPAARETIALLSQGFPHYAHLLGQESAFVAIDSGRRDIRPADVDLGIGRSLENTLHTTRSDYQKASEGQRKGTLFPQVLLACAVARSDALGYFSSSDVRAPLCAIAGKDYKVPNFAQHLDKLSRDLARGPILEKLDLGFRLRYRFRNPMLRPFIVMKGLVEGTLKDHLLTHLQRTPAEVSVGQATRPSPPTSTTT
jgi:hypothetical protein